MNEFKPARMLEVELSEPIPDLAARAAGEATVYERALVLVRLHGQPLGVVEVALEERLGADDYARQLWQALGEAVHAHLRADGLEDALGLNSAGLPPGDAPRCVQERENLLEKAPLVSVVISTRNRTDILPRCLQSVLALDYPRYEVVVVDNAPSSEATAELVRREYGHLSHVRYVRENAAGLSRARNRGVSEARGEIVAFTDDDATVDRHWLTGLVQGFARSDQVGCVTGLVLPLELETQAQAWFEEFGGFSKGFAWRAYDLQANRPRSPLFPYAAGQFGSGNNMAFRAQALQEIGDFDAALGAGSPTFGGEDLASFVAVIRKGYTLVYEPGAIVHHQHRRDYPGLRRQIRDCGVGLTAFLTKCVLDEPRSLLEFAAKVPYGLQYALSPSSPKNQKKRAAYPGELEAVEREGMVRGPLVYLRARWRARREAKRFNTHGLAAGVGEVRTPTKIG